jgi:acetyl-CoA carboxylase biotin carboxylase subunit
MFTKILIANRGEIAVRIMRTCKEMGIRTVAVYSEVDADSLHVKLADEAYPIGPGEAVGSYLNKEKILDIATKSGAEALHPGYGFLAENPDFVEMCEEQGVAFVGPPAECMHKAKPKENARELMRRIKIPIVPGYDKTLTNSVSGRLAEVQEVAESIGYPVIVKPSGGGGGIGMTVARNRQELVSAVHSVEDRGRALFGVSSFYVEKLLTGIKHIEFQVLADKHGNIIHLGERDCSIQRRFQKLIEESPCHILSPHLRMKMAVAALDTALALHYVNALTVEFFYVPGTQEFYFNEVNTRLQVEHCVTELATGIDIVREQIRIAAGAQLPYTQNDINFRDHALECRITAEDTLRNFLPCPGTVTGLHLPHGLGIRIDEGIHDGYEIPFYYDPLLLKLMTWGRARDEAISRMKRVLNETRIEGIETSLPFHRVVLEDDVFNAGHHTTDFVEKQNIIGRVCDREKAKGQEKTCRWRLRA